MAGYRLDGKVVRKEGKPWVSYANMKPMRLCPASEGVYASYVLYKGENTGLL